MSIACGGVYFTWVSPSLPRLTSDDSPIGTTITLEEGSWIASSAFLGGILGSLIGGILMTKIGPKQCILSSSIPYFAGWIIIILTKSPVMIIVAQGIGGIGSGISLSILPIYVSEIGDKDIRGKLGVLGMALVNTSNFIVLAFGPFVSYAALALLCSTFPLVFLITFYFVPESPYYLVKIGKKDAAMSNLRRLASGNVDEKNIRLNLEEIENTIQYDIENGTTLKELLTKENYRKSLLMVMGIKLLRAFNGTPAIDAYKQTIIESSNSMISPGISSIIFGLVPILAALICAICIDKIGRKLLITVAALICAVGLVAEGAYFYLQETNMDITSLSWLPTAGLSIYLFCNTVGVATLSNIIVGEMFATSIKGIAVPFFSIISSIVNFTVLKFYEPLSDVWGRYTVFWIFATVCILGALFVLLVLPETKGKSFIEIQRKLNKKSENI
ncbi:hypothetical protein ILUMI_17106 [Ignelater luminosus]|uniref:Major facilitator superfamily (MFS) profile domain-containing protein n=1 Tax=Ignelater luminosus TaxID=2038154 RepID=A0A8K0CPQ2_IGNLU|nr:hypothetical protein ILUMI_17106 [Ignelater luminosus]